MLEHKHIGRKHTEETKEKIRQTILKKRINLRCNMKFCDKKHRAKGYCDTHYSYFLKHGTFDTYRYFLKHGLP